MEDLKVKRDEFNFKVKEKSEEKKRLVEEIKKLKAKINESRELRDKANKEVKALKEKRIASFEEIKKLKKELEGIAQILDKLGNSVSGSYRRLTEELKALEWDYQTGVHSLKKEKELVKEMDALEKEIARSDLLYEKRKEFMRLQKRLRNLYTEANVYHSLLINRAKDSEKYHDMMMKSIKEIEKLEAKIKKLDEQIKEDKEKAGELHKQLKEIKIPVQRSEEEKEELLKKATEILTNFKAGKKITMEELSLLQELGLY